MFRIAFKTIVFCSLFVLTFSCKDETFRGSTGTKQPAVTARPSVTPKLRPTPNNPNVIPDQPWVKPNPTDCPEGQITQANLISKELISGSPSQYLEYVFRLSECGGLQTVKSNQILFDIDYATSSQETGFQYEVKSASGKSLVTGTLDTIKGSDLFGTTKEGFAHFKSNEFKIIQSDTPTVVLRIDFSNITFSKTEHNNTNYAQTYLKLANAAVTPAGNATKVKIITTP